MYTDKTGKFTVLSSKGYQYLLFIYSYDSNSILAESIKSRKKKKY